MTEAAKPAENQQNPPVTPAATPANEGGKPSDAGQTQVNKEPEKVTLTKEEHDKLVTDAAGIKKAEARQAASDRKTSRLEKLLGLKGKSSHFNKTPSGDKPSEEEMEEAQNQQAIEEDNKAKQGIMALAVDPIYREVLDADPTLRNLFVTNPLGALPLLAPDAVDAEDAIGLVKDVLQTRAGEIKEKVDKEKKEKENSENKPPESPPAGGVNPPNQETNAVIEAHKKDPNTERSIAGMIKEGLKNMGGKK